jgi:hypothetical protein
MKAPDACWCGPLALGAIPLLGLAANIGAQLLLSRLTLDIGQVRRQFISFGCGLLITVGVLLVLLSHASLGFVDSAGYFLLHTLSYVFLGFCFFNLINLNISSLRIRMLKEYYRQHPVPLSDADLIASYPVGVMLDARLARLESGRQIRRAEGRFFSQGGMVTHIGHFFAGLRHFLLSD